MEAGRIGRPHGLDGSFYVTRPDPRLLERGRTLGVAGRPRTVERRSGTDAKPILRLAGVAGREAIEALRGEPLWVDAAELPALEPGEYWAHELEGCTVVDGEDTVGVVTRMVALPSCEALEVGELLIPLVRDAIRSIDVEARRIDVDRSFLA